MRATFVQTARLGTVMVALAAVLAANAQAQVVPPPQNVISLNATASVEVTKDWLTVVFSTTRDALDAATVQAQLRQALDVALAEAKKVAKPGQLDVQTGAFSLYPKYAPKTNAIAGWQGSAELVVEGRDSQAIAQLTGRIQSLSIARVGFSLSREARQRVEGDVTAQAIDRFRARADAVARQFGFGGYTVREVSVAADAPVGGPVPMMRMRVADARAAMPEEALPVEAGKAVVTATVNGSVQMK